MTPCQHLVEHKRSARTHRACDRLAQAAPAAAVLLQRAGVRGDNLGSITAALMRLLERWGAAALQAAITEALARDVPHPNAVRLALERAREAAGSRHRWHCCCQNTWPGVTRRCARTSSARMTASHLPRRAPMSDNPPSQTALREHASDLRLHGLLAHWAEVMAQPEQARWVAQMLTWEAAERSRRSLERRLREAHIGRFKPLATSTGPGPSRSTAAPSRN